MISHESEQKDAYRLITKESSKRQHTYSFNKSGCRYTSKVCYFWIKCCKKYRVRTSSESKQLTHMIADRICYLL